jgi:hypothetical protein
LAISESADALRDSACLLDLFPRPPLKHPS